MVSKSGSIILIMKMESEVGSLSSCCCVKSLISNDFGVGLSDKPASLTVGYSRENGNKLGAPQVYKCPLALYKKFFD